MICTDCTSYLWILVWRWSNKTKTCCHNKIVIFIHCCCVLIVTLRHFVLLLELKHNRMSSIKIRCVFYYRCSECASEVTWQISSLCPYSFQAVCSVSMVTEAVVLWTASFIQLLLCFLIVLLDTCKVALSHQLWYESFMICLSFQEICY